MFRGERIHRAQIRGHALDVRFEIAIAGLVLGEPDVAMPGDQRFALGRAACRVDRRVRQMSRLGDDIAGIGDSDLSIGSGQGCPDMGAVEGAFEIEI
jgi:hypothetical protein